MSIEQKTLDLDKTKYKSELDWATHTPGIWMNLLGGIRLDQVTNKYVVAPIKYSDVNLEGEKIKFASGQEYQVIFSCLAIEYANKRDVYDMWWNKVEELKEAYKQQKQIEAHVKSNNVDIKKLRNEGNLFTQEELDKGV